jgi:5'-nucleotidase
LIPVIVAILVAAILTLRGGEGEIRLVILHHNDGESQLVQAPGGVADFGGVARFAGLVHRLRSEAVEEGAAVIMLSSGDNVLSGPELSVSLIDGSPFYDATALNLIGYDALTIGNHEFDLGPDLVARLVEEVGNATFISANLDMSGEPALQALVEQGKIAPSVVVTKRGRRIGIIGATTTDLPFISSLRNVRVRDRVAEIVQAEIDRLTGEGVDVIILSTHLQSLQAEINLAAGLTGVDAIVAGGSNALLADDSTVLIPGDGDPFGPYPITATLADGSPVAVVTTPGDYTYLGRLVLNIDSDGKVTGVEGSSGLRRVAGGGEPDAVVAHPQVQAQVTEPVMAALDRLASTPVGITADPLDGRRSPGVRTMETNLGDLVADAVLWNARRLAEGFAAGRPAVALINGGGIRNDSVIPPGPVTKLDTFDIVPFNNVLVVVEDVPPEQVKVLLENAVSRVEGSDGRFAQIAGLKFVYDPEGTAQLIEDKAVVTPGTRVLFVELSDGTVLVSNGEVTEGAPHITVASVDFLVNGGDQYLFGNGRRTRLGTTAQQSLLAYIQDDLNGIIVPESYPEGGTGRITTPDQVFASIPSRAPG